MTKELNVLRLQVMKVPGDHGGKRQYPAQLRGELREALDRWTLGGGTVAEFSRLVGVHVATLHSWREARQGGGKSKLRAVAIKGVSPAASKAAESSASLVLRFPKGAVIEGLTLSQVAELLQ